MCDGPVAEQQNVAARYEHPKSSPFGRCSSHAGLVAELSRKIFAGFCVNADSLFVSVIWNSVVVSVRVVVIFIANVNCCRRLPPLLVDCRFRKLISEISVLSIRYFQQIICCAVILRAMKPEGRQIRNSVCVRSLINAMPVSKSIDMVKQFVNWSWRLVNRTHDRSSLSC